MNNFTENSIFVFTKFDQSYRWRLIAGSVFHSNVLDEFEMPAHCLIDEVNIESMFDGNLPFGLRLPMNTKLKFNMGEFKSNSLEMIWDIIRQNSKYDFALTWTDIDTDKYLIKSDFRMLNCWVFEKKNLDTNSWEIVDIFTQSNKKASVKVEKGVSTFEIELVSIWKYCLEKIEFQMFNHFWYYEKENFTSPSFRSFCGLPDDAYSDTQLDYSTRRNSLQVGNKNLKYWSVFNFVQTSAVNFQKFIKRSYYIQDTKSEQRAANGRLHLRLIKSQNAFLLMSYAFWQIFENLTRNKLFTAEIRKGVRLPNPLNLFKFYKQMGNEDFYIPGQNPWGSEINPNDIYLTESIYEARTDGTSAKRWLDAECTIFTNPLYSQYKNAWDFFSEFYQGYPVIVKFNAKTCRFEMNSIFNEDAQIEVSSNMIDSESLEYEMMNREFNAYELQATSASSSNTTKRIVMEESESDSNQTKIIASHIFNTWRDKYTEYFYWQNNSRTEYVLESKTVANFDNIGNFPVGKIVTKMTIPNWQFHDGNEKQVFEGVANHFQFQDYNILPTWFDVEGIVQSEKGLTQYIERTNINGFTGFCMQIMREFLLNSGNSAVLSFKSKYYDLGIETVGIPINIRTNKIFRDFLDLKISDLPSDINLGYISYLKKNYSTGENEIKIFLRGDK